MNKQAYEHMVGLALSGREGLSKAAFMNTGKKFMVGTGIGMLGFAGLSAAGLIGIAKWQKNRRIRDIENEISENAKAIENLKASGASGMDIKEYVDRNVLLKTELSRINSSIL